MLAFHIADIIQVPFGYLMEALYRLTNNYGFALILFSVIVQLVLLPITAKSKKSMMKMSRLTPQLQEIQRRYANDPARQNQAMQDLYREEGVSMGGGCLWSFVPMLLLLPLYTVVRQPIVYMLHENMEVANQVVEVIKGINPELFGGNAYYHQMIAAQYIPQYAEAIKAAIPAIGDIALEGINFGFIGIDLGAVPQFNVFASTWAWNWAHIGALLIALCSAGYQVVSMLIMQKMNDSLVTDKDGIQDKETAENSQTAQTNKVMMWTMPLMMLWIGFTVPCALSLYWFVGGVVRTVEDVILNNRYRKIYDAEDAERLKRRLEQDRIEAEKERIRAQRRAENPDGITENTSKKRLQKQQRDAEAAQKAAAAKEYAMKKGKLVEDEEENLPLSGIADRPYCKGRAYDPNRYASDAKEN
ncbi:MAG: YidC/Oxa1 family membrane protein insertase [Candidatus Faecousia sp.]|nr:YidC/Oxa1 family membrane protein insertase [Candidatus Faecousia sp.]